MAFQFDMMPGSHIKWDQENLIYWIMKDHNPIAIISYDDDIAIDRIYYLIMVNPEYDPILGRDIYHNMGLIYKGFDFNLCREMAMELIGDC